MTIGEFQVSAILLLGILTASLVVTPLQNSGAGSVYKRARWFLTGGTLLLAIQFWLQYKTGFRTNGEITKSIFINLIFFLPASWLINLSMLYLLRNGHVDKWVWITGPICYVIALAILIPNLLAKGNWLSERNAELIASIIYGLTLLAYNAQEYFELRRTHKALDNYYDQSKKNIMNWLSVSIMILALVALSSPVSIFTENPLILAPIGLAVIVGVYYYVLNFICFGVSENEHTMFVANEEEEKDEIELPAALRKDNGNNDVRVEQAIRKWIEERGHLKTGTTIQDAVDEMQIPRYLLVQWIKNTKFEVFSRWISYLRVEEAKRLLVAHPEYSNEAVAHECGFSSRSYFQKVFRDITGMTPLEFQTEQNQAKGRK